MSSSTEKIEITGVSGIGTVQAGDDIADLIADTVGSRGLRAGDIVVVSSKIVSKAEGRVLTDVDRDEAIDAETVRVVSEWTTPAGRTRIAQTRHGLVMAAAGVDASNVTPGSIALLPRDPDESARTIRTRLQQRFGVAVGVIVSDTAGRAWRQGVVDIAIGAAGVTVLDDLRGSYDRFGNKLDVTVVAVADEIAAASELVRSKLSSVPVAIVRGLSHLTSETNSGASTLIRPEEEDRFRLGTPEALRQGSARGT